MDETRLLGKEAYPRNKLEMETPFTLQYINLLKTPCSTALIPNVSLPYCCQLTKYTMLQITDRRGFLVPLTSRLPRIIVSPVV